MTRLGVAQSRDTLLRSFKRGVSKLAAAPARVVGVDDWSWRKGSTYGTIMVDLERREVLDVLQDRSAGSTASWLECRPTIEIVSRNRRGLYAQGAAQGAPQARQVADRFHLLQNLRHAIRTAANSSPEPATTTRAAGSVRPHPPLWTTGGDRASSPRPGGRRGRSQLGFERVKAAACQV